MSSDSAPYGMSDLDIYLANRYGPKAVASDWANTTEDWAKIRPLTNPLGTPTADLALFEKLPSDTMNSILRHLDVKSFCRFRNINAKAHRIAETVLDCKEVMVHGSTAVINLIRTGLSPHITIGEIHKALTSPKCEFCDDYGSILFLLTCTRTCHKCLQTSPRMAVIGSEEMLTYYPRFTTYGTHDNRPHLLETLAKSSMRSIKVRNHSRPGRMLKGIRGVLVDDVFSSSELGIDTSDPVKDLFYDEWLQYRTAASIHFPYLNTSTGEIEEGRSCKGCHEAFEKRLIRANGPLGDVRINPDAEDRDRCYSHKDFEKHFETCAHAQRIWMKRVPPGRESWFAANGGSSRITQNIKVSRSELLHTCFYKRTKYYFPTLDPKAHEFSQEVRRFFSRCHKTQTPNLGVLARLPQDLLEEIVLHLDIDSFRRFRQVSRRARYLSTVITIYQRVLRCAPDALNALRRTDLSGYVSYSDVYTALTTSKCTFCGRFGEFMFLPTAKRCCFECLRASPETALVNQACISRRGQWKDLYTEHAEDLAEALKSIDVRSFKTHNWDDVQKMSKTRGVLAKDLLAAYIKVDKGLKEPGQSFLKPGWLHYRLAASIIFPSLNPRTGKLQTGQGGFYYDRANIRRREQENLADE
ncbi:hypothetical protein FOFC_10807 [Fusarium oxysporum]|nr:hypothetical protein FOFC_10807 [Fusarium oxysporum]